MSNRTTGWRSPRHERGERQLRQMIQMLWFGVYLVWEHATRSAAERDRLRILWERSALLLLTKRCIQAALFVGVGVAQTSAFSDEELAQQAMKSFPEMQIDSAVLRTAATLIAADVLVALAAAQTELGTHRAQRRANRERGT